MSELYGPKQADYHENNLQEVHDDGNPHVAQEVKHLALYCANLKKNKI